MNPTKRIDIINIVSLVVSAIVAVIIPFELFLFVYAILGPLHYLTEISWLHDKKYYTTGKYDTILLVGAVLLITICINKNYIGLADWEITDAHVSRILFVALGSAFFFAFIKNTLVKWGSIICLIFLSVIADRIFLLITIFLPTLVHVFVFTFFFMLAGALKSKSIYGYITVALHILFPLILFYVIRDIPALDVSEQIRNAYSTLKPLNLIIVSLINGTYFLADSEPLVYTAGLGMTVMRFIAFAYTYHYLNWFTKTEIIQWHKVPKSRFIVVIAVWLMSIAIYLVDYDMGFKWLFLLSLLHVVLEFPLNFVAFRNIFRELKGRFATR